MREETQAIELKSPLLSFSTEVTAILTWESSFDDMDDDESISDEIQCIQRIFEPNDSQFHSSIKESNNNSIFRPKEDCDYAGRELYANIVRMEQENYEVEQPQVFQSPLKVLTSTWNSRSNSPTQLKYPDEKSKEEARRQFLRQHAAEHHIHRAVRQHNLVMDRAVELPRGRTLRRSQFEW